MKFTVHCLIKNEDIWVKSAIESVLPYAEKILVFDTGSTDKTVEQVKSISSPKITFAQKGVQNHRGLVDLRREMIKATNTPWFLILDGDEIWPETELKKIIDAAEKVPQNVVALVNRSRNCIGDIYHYLPDEAGNYNLAGRVGNLNIRMMKKTRDLSIVGEYPLESFTNSQGSLQNQDKNLFFVDCWYLHVSFLKRSSTDLSKKSGSFAKARIWEKGLSINEDQLPEALKKFNKNAIQLQKRNTFYEIGSLLASPLISLKRKLK